jgi:hypothetical protein
MLPPKPRRLIPAVCRCPGRPLARAGPCATGQQKNLHRSDPQMDRASLLQRGRSRPAPRSQRAGQRHGPERPITGDDRAQQIPNRGGLCPQTPARGNCKLAPIAQPFLVSPVHSSPKPRSLFAERDAHNSLCFHVTVSSFFRPSKLAAA